jgi:hypothetical protein
MRRGREDRRVTLHHHYKKNIKTFINRLPEVLVLPVFFCKTLSFLIHFPLLSIPIYTAVARRFDAAAGRGDDFRRTNITAASSSISVLKARSSVLPGQLYPTVLPGRVRGWMCWVGSKKYGHT